MKLRNKKTGVIKNFALVATNDSANDVTLAQVNEEWEDYEEDKKYWFIDEEGEIKSKELGYFNLAQDSIGNRFKTKEEAEKAVEKLKAWKRLKDAGFWFKSDSIINGHKYEYILRLQCEEDKRFKRFKENEALFNDLKLLFRGKV